MIAGRGFYGPAVPPRPRAAESPKTRAKAGVSHDPHRGAPAPHPRMIPPGWPLRIVAVSFEPAVAFRASVRRHRRAQGGSSTLRSIRPTRATVLARSQPQQTSDDDASGRG
jgi:hypothetical protein